MISQEKTDKESGSESILVLQEENYIFAQIKPSHSLHGPPEGTELFQCGVNIAIAKVTFLKDESLRTNYVLCITPLYKKIDNASGKVGV